MYRSMFHLGPKRLIKRNSLSCLYCSDLWNYTLVITVCVFCSFVFFFSEKNLIVKWLNDGKLYMNSGVVRVPFSSNGFVQFVHSTNGKWREMNYFGWNMAKNNEHTDGEKGMADTFEARKKNTQLLLCSMGGSRHHRVFVYIWAISHSKWYSTICRNWNDPNIITVVDVSNVNFSQSFARFSVIVYFFFCFFLVGDIWVLQSMCLYITHMNDFKCIKYGIPTFKSIKFIQSMVLLKSFFFHFLF